ncbi:MAG: DNA-binding protein WhiA [Actinomycetota bacterium]|nr:DNA-binding protein WhiA [Actinomycetota bacterium]
MAMTTSLTQELSSFVVTRTCCRKAEIAAVLRFAGGLRVIGGRVVVEAELQTAAAARRLGQDMTAVYGRTCELVVTGGGDLPREPRFVVRVASDGQTLARQTGLIDAKGRLVRGLTPRVVHGPVCDAEAAWRGAFLARGWLSEPGRSALMRLTCPGPEAALALVGAARRMGIAATTREVHGEHRVIIRDGEAIATMLTRLGAYDTALAWQQHRMRRQAQATARRLPSFGDANLQRATRAAVAASARVERAMDILGEQAPDHLAQVGLLRIEHQHASLQELGRLARPPLTKDTIAGRIRRLVAMADQMATDCGIPGTDATLAPDVLG